MPHPSVAKKVVRKRLKGKRLSAFLSRTSARKHMKTKRMKKAAGFADGRRSRKGQGRGAGIDSKPCSILSQNYDCVNTRIS